MTDNLKGMVIPTDASQVLSQEPYVAEYQNFLRKKQCQAILSEVPNLQFTQGTVRIEGKRQINIDQRKAFTHKIRASDPECLSQWPRRIAEWLNLPNEQWIENSLLVHYPRNGEFKVHTDVVSTADNAGSITNRVATVIVYLNEDFGGGQTVFPCIRTAVTPKTGKALLFVYNYDSNEINTQTLHYGQRVDRDKYVLIFFIRDNEYPEDLRELSVY